MKKEKLKTLMILALLISLWIILMPVVFAKVQSLEFETSQALNQNLRDIREAKNKEDRDRALDDAESNNLYLQHIQFDRDLAGQDDED